MRRAYAFSWGSLVAARQCAAQNQTSQHTWLGKAFLSLPSYYWNSTLFVFCSSSCFPVPQGYSWYSGKPQPFSQFAKRVCMKAPLNIYRTGIFKENNRVCFSNASRLPISEDLPCKPYPSWCMLVMSILVDKSFSYGLADTRLGHSIRGRQRTPW